MHNRTANKLILVPRKPDLHLGQIHMVRVERVLDVEHVDACTVPTGSCPRVARIDAHRRGVEILLILVANRLWINVRVVKIRLS